MKTWEVIKELYNHPEKRFRLMNDDNVKLYIKDVYEEGETLMYDCVVIEDKKSGFLEPFCINDTTRNYEWEEDKKLVSWSEAIKAWAEGKTICCILDGRRFTYQGICEYMLSYEDADITMSKTMINEGNWYIIG